jgi:RNA polymerase sigma-70 factor (ECF subfamily)
VAIAVEEDKIITDKEQIQLILKGDNEAFLCLYRRYYERIYRLAYGMAGRPQTAEDLTQEIFFRMHQKLDRFDGTSGFSTWFYRLAVNCSLNYRRGDKNESKMEAIEDIELLPNPDYSNGFEENILKKEVQSHIRCSLLTLKPKLRMVFILKDIEGMTYDEIAARMDCSAGTVASRLSHARLQMAHSLKHLRGTF